MLKTSKSVGICLITTIVSMLVAHTLIVTLPIQWATMCLAAPIGFLMLKHLADRKVRKVKVYVDSVDWDCHLEFDSSGIVVYPDPEDVERRECVTSGGCGIYECEITFVRVIKEENLVYEPILKS